MLAIIADRGSILLVDADAFLNAFVFMILIFVCFVLVPWMLIPFSSGMDFKIREKNLLRYYYYWWLVSVY